MSILRTLGARPLDPSARFVIRNTVTGGYFMRRESPELGAPLQPVFLNLKASDPVVPRFSRRYAELLVGLCLQASPFLQLEVLEVQP